MRSSRAVAVWFVAAPFLGGSAQTLNDIPLAINSDYKYEAKVNMSSTDPQTLNFELSSSTGYTVVAGSDCNNCTGVTRYDRSKSQSASDLSGTVQVSLPDGSASGDLIKEDCTLYTTNGKGWSYPRQTIVVANESVDLFSDTGSGILGLGRNKHAGDFSATLYYPWFLRNPAKINFSIGMALNNPYDSSKDGGVLHWLHINSDSHKGDVVTVNATHTKESDWVILVDGWSLEPGGSSSLTDNSTFLAALDPFQPDIFLPKATATFIYSKIAGSQAQAPTTLGDMWSVPCATKVKFSLYIGGKKFLLDERQLVRQAGAECYGTLHGWSDEDKTLVLLGSSFISSAYLIYTIDRQGEGSVGIGERNFAGPSKAISRAAIAGIAVGSAAFVLALGGIIAWLIIRRIRKAKKEARSQAADPFMESKSPEPVNPALDSLPPSSSAYTTEFDHTRRLNATSWAGTSTTSQPVSQVYDDNIAPPEYTPQSPRSASFVEPAPPGGKAQGYTH